MNQQSTANLIRITLGCFISYAIVSGMLSQIGTLSSAMADFFQRPVTETGARFSWLSIGITAGSVLSLFVYETLSLKKTFILCYVMLIAALSSIYFIDTWEWLPVGLLLAGVTASLGLNTAAVTLAVTFDAKKRAAVLLCTDVCFAGAGIIAAPGAAALLESGYGWSSSYMVIALAAALLLVVVTISRYPPTAKEAETAFAEESWPLALFLCGGGLAVYLFGQISMLLWLPNYIETELGAERDVGAASIGRYWTGMALGQMLLVVALIRFDPHKLLAGICVISVLVSTLLWNLGSPDELVMAALLLGLCNAGILKLTMSFAASLVDHPQRVITTLLFCASLGQVISPQASSMLVEATSMKSALVLVTLSYSVMMVTILFALYQRRSFSEGVKTHVS